MIGYTFSKSIDQASSLSDPINPFNFVSTWRLESAWISVQPGSHPYDYRMPRSPGDRPGGGLDWGGVHPGITRASSGFPVTISSDGDRSLMGSLPNGVNNKSLDLPDFAPGPLPSYIKLHTILATGCPTSILCFLVRTNWARPALPPAVPFTDRVWSISISPSEDPSAWQRSKSPGVPT